MTNSKGSNVGVVEVVLELDVMLTGGAAAIH